MNQTMCNCSMVTAAGAVDMFSCANVVSHFAFIKDAMIVVSFFVALIGILGIIGLIGFILIGLLSLILFEKTAPRDRATNFV